MTGSTDGVGAYRQMSGVVQLADQNDPAIGTYSVDCGEDDFASPILGLVAEGASGQKNLEEQRSWVIGVYQKIVDRCIHDPLRKQIALASASTLIDALNKFYSGDSFRCFYQVEYNSAILDKINPPSIEAIAEHLNEKYGVDARAHNPIPFFTYVYSIPDDVLWQARLAEIRNRLLESTLKKIFPFDGELSDAYRVLFPSIVKAFDQAKEKRVALNFVEIEQDDRFRAPEQGDWKCCVVL